MQLSTPFLIYLELSHLFSRQGVDNFADDVYVGCGRGDVVVFWIVRFDDDVAADRVLNAFHRQTGGHAD